jgi:hypothetical protein
MFTWLDPINQVLNNGRIYLIEFFKHFNDVFIKNSYQIHLSKTFLAPVLDVIVCPTQI